MSAGRFPEGRALALAFAAAAILCPVGPAVVSAPAAPAPEWRVDGAGFRKLLELAPVQAPKKSPLLPRKVASLRLAACEVVLEGEDEEGIPRAAVFDSGGRKLKADLREIAPGSGLFMLTFELSPRSRGPFELYYPVPEGETKPLFPDARPGDSSEDAPGVSVTVYEIPPGVAANMKTVDKAALQVRGKKRAAGSGRRRAIDDRTNEFGPDDNYIAVYEGHLFCPEAGRYTLALDADDRAFLLLDGELALAGGAPGKLPVKPFPYRTQRNLSVGVHHLLLYHVEGQGAQRARLAWKRPKAPPGELPRPVPPSFFVAAVPARVTAFERRLPGGRPAGLVFSRAALRERLSVPAGPEGARVPVTEWRLECVLPGARGVPSCIWREGDRKIGGGRFLRVFASGLGGTRRVALEVPGAGSYVRPVRALPADDLEDESVPLRVEVVGLPNFVYPHEPVELAVAAINDSRREMKLELLERSRGAERRVGPFTLPGVPAGKDVMARRMYKFTRRFAAGELKPGDAIEYRLGPPGAPAVRTFVHVLGSRGTVPPLRAAYGSIWMGKGAGEARALVVLPYDTEDDLRLWAPIRSLRLAPTGRKYLFFGDELASGGAARGRGLARRLAAELGKRGGRFVVEPFGEGSYPIHAAAARADGALGGGGWRKVFISLGLLDVRAGTPLWEFERGLDFLLDRVRSRSPGSRLVVIGPPPEYGRGEVSARYARAAKELCKRHGVPFADLHGLVESLPDPWSGYRDKGPDDGVRFPYPLGEVMDEIAELVLGM